jgi:uncharacterized protein (DUF58 family)
MEEFHYRIGWRSAAAQPGGHGGSRGGAGGEFQGYLPLSAEPDPRHLDVRATIADPFGQLMVRHYRQRSVVPVFLVADLSASMAWTGSASKPELLAQFASALGYSSYRAGDPFGFLPCAETILWDLVLPLRWQRGAAEELRGRLSSLRPSGKNARGLLEVAPHLGRQRALVFLASDFHLPEDQLRAVLESLAHHQVVPVVLWDSAEYEALPPWGWADLADPETGAKRRIFLRPALRRAWRDRFEARREALNRLFGQYGMAAFFLQDRFDADAMTCYFHPD